MIRTLIVDDEKLARDLLAKLVGRDQSLELVGQCSDGQQAIDSIHRLEPELVFLDVQMPIMDGLAVAKSLQHLKCPPYIIFVTAYDKYAIQAFDCHALDYVVKPIDKARLYASIQRAKSAIEQKNIVAMAQRMTDMMKSLDASTGISCNSTAVPHNIIINTGHQLISIRPEDIIWIEAANQYVKVHVLEQHHVMSENLSQFSHKLDAKYFVRVHRSALINISKVVSVSRKGSGAHLITLEGGAQVVLSRGRSDLLPVLLDAAHAR